MEAERAHLSRIDSIDIIDFVKKSVEILMSMREEEFTTFNRNWQLQEKLRSSKKLPVEVAEPSKKYRTPKNSRFFAKMKKETETLATPKTNKKRNLKLTGSSGKQEEDDDMFEYEVCL